MQWSFRFVSGFLVIASIVGMAFALYLEHVQGLSPCPLCVFQRVGLMGLGFISLIALIHNPKSTVGKRIYALLGSLSILWSAGVAARHVWLQNLPPDQVPSCGPGLNYLIDALPLKSVLAQVLTGSGECAVIDWTWLGFSVPELSLAFFSVLLVMIVLAIIKSKQI